MKTNTSISVIIPVFNESGNVAHIHSRLSKTIAEISPDYELVFVNDGSRDNTLELVVGLAEHDAHVKFIDLSRNFGHQIAVSAGLDYVQGDVVVIIDADLQDPPELIHKMYQKYKEGFDVVYAQRIKREGESFFKRLTAKYFYRILKRLTNVNIPVDTGDFRLMDRKIVDVLNKMPEKNKFLRGQIAWMGFKQTPVFFERQERQFGATGYPLSKMLRLAMDGITGFSDAPLLFVSRLGIGISALSFVIIVYAIISHFFLHQAVTGWTSLIISSAFLGGVQLIAIGIIGEYISRMNKNLLGRPLYLVAHTNCEKSPNPSEK